METRPGKACSIYEAIYILDGLFKNESDIQPDIIHGDTQNQSEVVFGLCYLLGIRLMPRIRNWKKLDLCRPNNDSKYKNIDELFNDYIDWDFIKTHLPDMYRVALSIREGKIMPSTILRKLSSDEQRKLIKYNHLIASCLCFYNVSCPTDLLHRLNKEGLSISKHLLSSFSPYITSHINRSGSYFIDLKHKVPELVYKKLGELSDVFLKLYDCGRFHGCFQSLVL